MLQLTRTWNSITAAAFMRRGLALARDYAGRRVAFGAPLAQKPLHADTLAGLQAELEGALHLSFWLAELIGADESGEIDAQQLELLRLLTSIAKLTTGRQAVAVALLRDSQVLPIWEGTTNVLALDTLRALGQGQGLAALQAKVDRCAGSARERRLVEAGRVAQFALDHAGHWLRTALQGGTTALELGARRLAMTLGRVLELALLVEHAQWSLDQEEDGRARAAALRFAQAPVDLIVDGLEAEEAFALANDLPIRLAADAAG
jgi:alkylation response protein AidB-like acyl-CoA dehydrogenase